MSALTATPTPAGLVPTSRDRAPASTSDDLFDLDLRVQVPVIDESLWSMTNDGCGQTCESACTPSCTQNG
ncbi:FxLD family lanthipeptide [Nocardiopsis sp. CNS-639]|uniref:FxLD family lanthipeptide n=1 Tax=Nocardiopsis sp. CNS-639 TaxID=1169153 RepID=UPI00037E0D33|nr:FxLD family lanthipeptide [Nocardiopsis sp. CNS-639]